SRQNFVLEDFHSLEPSLACRGGNVQLPPDPLYQCKWRARNEDRDQKRDCELTYYGVARCVRKTCGQFKAMTDEFAAEARQVTTSGHDHRQANAKWQGRQSADFKLDVVTAEQQRGHCQLPQGTR